MKENIVYTTPEGNTHKVLMFDEINKMAYIHIIGGHHRWVHESEYSTWTVNDTAEMPKIYIPDIPAQMTDEQINSQSKTESHAVQITAANEVDVFEQATDGETMGSGNTQPEITTEESKAEGKEKVKKIKVKKAKA